MALTLTRRIAEIINPMAFTLTPEMYGLTTHKEMMERTVVGAVQQEAMNKAREVIAAVRAFDRRD